MSLALKSLFIGFRNISPGYITSNVPRPNRIHITGLRNGKDGWKGTDEEVIGQTGAPSPLTFEVAVNIVIRDPSKSWDGVANLTTITQVK